MKINTPSLLALILSIPLAACAENPVGQVPGPNPGPGNPPTPGTPMVLEGEYELTSHFDISIKDFTEGADFAEILEDVADDPYGAVADRIASAISFDLASILIEQVLNEYLGSDLENEIEDFADSILEISGSFDLVTRLEVKGSGDNFTVVHKTVGMDVEFGDESFSMTFEQPAQANSKLAVKNGKATIEGHKLAIPYAGMLGTMIDAFVVPMFDPAADDIGEALDSIVDCAGVGADIADSGVLPGFSADVIMIACRVGLAELGEQIYDRVDSIDSLATALEMNGTATFSDDNGDGKADKVAGSWDGNFAVGGGANYTGAAPFSGRRVR